MNLMQLKYKQMSEQEDQCWSTWEEMKRRVEWACDQSGLVANGFQIKTERGGREGVAIPDIVASLSMDMWGPVRKHLTTLHAVAIYFGGIPQNWIPLSHEHTL